MTTNRRYIATLIAVTAFALTGCGTSEGEAKPVAQPETAAPATSAASTAPVRSPTDTRFLRAIEKAKVAGAYSASDHHIKLAHTVCKALRTGVSFTVSVDTIRDAGRTQRDATILAGAATTAYCPEFAEDAIRYALEHG